MRRLPHRRLPRSRAQSRQQSRFRRRLPLLHTFRHPRRLRCQPAQDDERALPSLRFRICPASQQGLCLPQSPHTAGRTSRQLLLHRYLLRLHPSRPSPRCSQHPPIPLYLRRRQHSPQLRLPSRLRRSLRHRLLLPRRLCGIRGSRPVRAGSCGRRWRLLRPLPRTGHRCSRRLHPRRRSLRPSTQTRSRRRSRGEFRPGSSRSSLRPVTPGLPPRCRGRLPYHLRLRDSCRERLRERAACEHPRSCTHGPRRQSLRLRSLRFAGSTTPGPVPRPATPQGPRGAARACSSLNLVPRIPFRWRASRRTSLRTRRPSLIDDHCSVFLEHNQPGRVRTGFSASGRVTPWLFLVVVVLELGHDVVLFLVG